MTAFASLWVQAADGATVCNLALACQIRLDARGQVIAYFNSPEIQTLLVGPNEDGSGASIFATLVAALPGLTSVTGLNPAEPPEPTAG